MLAPVPHRQYVFALPKLIRPFFRHRRRYLGELCRLAAALLKAGFKVMAPLVRNEIWSVIRAIKETGIASIIIDKEIKALLGVAERNLIISKGSIVYQGGSEELTAHPIYTNNIWVFEDSGPATPTVLYKLI
ncbi:MAG: hypothetical protein GY935_05585 [Gammaproteobacteria bacterium]|nr:hypothetical protein [Gammaproteobacteria bacterium]